MQTETIQTIQEILVTGVSYYSVVAVFIFLGCLVMDRYDKWFKINRYDHTSFPFFMCTILYAFYAVLWLPYTLTDICKWIKSKKENK